MVSVEQETDFLGSLLSEMDSIPVAAPATRKRKPEPETHRGGPSNGKARARTGGYERSGAYMDAETSSDGPLDNGFRSGASSDDDFDSNTLSPRKKLKPDPEGMAPTIASMSKFKVHESSGDEMDFDTSFDGVDMDAFMDIDEDFGGPSTKPVKKEEPQDIKIKPAAPRFNGTSAKDVKVKKSLDDTPTWLSVYDSLSVSSGDTFGPTAGSSRATQGSNSSVLEEDGSFRFFWLDYLEHEGRLYFIGKTQDKKTKAWLSCCVTVENLQRNLFILPRERRVEEDEETGELVETDIVPALTDVYSDFDRVRRKAGINRFKAKFVKRRYAFGERDVPRGETQWLKVVYGFDGMGRIALFALLTNSINRAANFQ